MTVHIEIQGGGECVVRETDGFKAEMRCASRSNSKLLLIEALFDEVREKSPLVIMFAGERKAGVREPGEMMFYHWKDEE